MTMPLGVRKISLPFSGNTFYHGLGTKDIIFQIVRSDGLLFSPNLGFLVHKYDHHLEFFELKKTPAGDQVVPFSFDFSYITVIG